MKKIVVLVLLFAFLLSVNTFADEGFAVGVAATFGVTNFLEGGGPGTPGVIGLLKIPGIPMERIFPKRISAPRSTRPVLM